MPKPVTPRRVLLRLLLAIVAIDLGVRAFSGVWAKYSPDDYALKVERCASQPRDVVIVGGSPVSEGVIPWPGVYALGLNGGTTSEFYHAVVHGCPTPPNLLVYGITASDLNDARHEPHGPGSLMTAGDVFDWAVRRPDSRGWVLRQYANYRLGDVSAVFRYRHGVRMWAALQAPDCCPDAAKEARELVATHDSLRSGDGYAPSAGYVHRRYDLAKAAGDPGPPFTFLNDYRTGSHLQYLHRLISWCEKSRTPLVLVDLPVTADLERQYPEAFREYRQLLSRVESDHRLMVIRAHRDLVGLTDTEFADNIHLNGAGAKRFSEWLRVELTRLRSPSDPADDRVRAQAGGRP